MFGIDLTHRPGRPQLDHFLELSPYRQAGLYRSIEVDVLQIEAGGLR